MQSSAAQPAMTTDPLLSLLTNPAWTIAPSRQQPCTSEIELTHHRRMPLPYALDFSYNGETFRCLYAGHGFRHVVYTFSEDDSSFGHAVLKLTKNVVKEPAICQELQSRCSVAQPAIKLCPQIYDQACCMELNSKGERVGYWFAWLTEHAIPLNEFIGSLDLAHRQIWLSEAFYKQAAAAQCGLLLSDNNLLNFGVVKDTVVIINCGSRDLEAKAIPKAGMKRKAPPLWLK